MYLLFVAEEELKRLNQAFNEVYDEGGYAAVGFNYNWGNQPEEEEEESKLGKMQNYHTALTNLSQRSADFFQVLPGCLPRS